MACLIGVAIASACEPETEVPVDAGPRDAGTVIDPVRPSDPDPVFPPFPDGGTAGPMDGGPPLVDVPCPDDSDAGEADLPDGASDGGSPTACPDAAPQPGSDAGDAGLCDTPACADGGQRPDGGEEPDAEVDAGRCDSPACLACPEGPLPVNRVRIVPALGREAELVGVRLQGSNSGPTNDFVDLARVEEPPREGAAVDLTFVNEALYRYVKIYAPDPGTGSLAELELYHGGVRVGGAPFGTAGADGESTFERAFDGDPATAFEAGTEGGSYVGLDVGIDAVAPAPTFSPAAGAFTTAPRVELTSAAAGATLRYTLDGSNPSRTSGTVYDGPLALPEGQTIVRAIAYGDCLFESPVASATYNVGTDAPPPLRGLRSYHIGNSLTDTINPWLEPIADSSGVDHVYARWTIPGATIQWLYEHPGQGFGDPAGAQRIETFAPSFAPIDHVSLQPFADPSLNKQGPAALGLLEPVRASSPDVQVWVYAQWPERSDFTRSSFAVGASWADPPWNVPRQPTTWEEATENQLLFHEAFRQYLDERLPGKQVLVVPGGLALVRLKRAIDAGQVPGIDDFFGAHYSDALHLSTKGQYLVSLVFYACLYQRSPEGQVTHAGTTLTEEQARIYQRIAWETVRGYRFSGVSP